MYVQSKYVQHMYVQSISMYKANGMDISEILQSLCKLDYQTALSHYTIITN